MSESVVSLYRKFRVPPNIRRHMSKVAAVATFLARRVKDGGDPIDIKAIRKASLLHDLFRIVDISEKGYNELIKDFPKNRKVWDRMRKDAAGLSHEEYAYRFFSSGEPVIARLIRAHTYSKVRDASGWEEKIVTYADKCVMHDKIVPMMLRLREGHGRYPSDENHAMAMDKAYRSLEREILMKAGLTSFPAKRFSASFKNRQRKRA